VSAEAPAQIAGADIQVCSTHVATSASGLTNRLARSSELSVADRAFWRVGNDWYVAYLDP